MHEELKLRPLERENLKFVHDLNNDANIMSYWFEEPYEAFVELQDEFFVNGSYHNAIRMCIFQQQYVEMKGSCFAR